MFELTEHPDILFAQQLLVVERTLLAPIYNYVLVVSVFFHLTKYVLLSFITHAHDRSFQYCEHVTFFELVY